MGAGGRVSQGDDKAGNAECPIAGGWKKSSKIRTHIRTHVRIRRELYW